MTRLVIRSKLLLSALALAVAPQALAAAEPEPILGTPEQDDAEQMALALLEHPDVKAIQAGLREQLRATEIGQTRDGAATIDRAVECLSNSLIFKEIATYRAVPYAVWA